MPTLIGDLRPQAAALALADEYRALRQAGEPLILHAAAMEGEEFVVVTSPQALEAALEDERIPRLDAAAPLPAWVPLEECHRVLLVAELPLSPAEAGWVAAVHAAGCEAVQLLSPAEAVELSQSWHSGRRAGRHLTP